jgi:hypothetical protein
MVAAGAGSAGCAMTLLSTLRGLMARMGHTSTRAALVYLHDTDDRQRAIAAAVSDLASRELGQLTTDRGSGTTNETGT